MVDGSIRTGKRPTASSTRIWYFREEWTHYVQNETRTKRLFAEGQKEKEGWVNTEGFEFSSTDWCLTVSLLVDQRDLRFDHPYAPPRAIWTCMTHNRALQSPKTTAARKRWWRGLWSRSNRSTSIQAATTLQTIWLIEVKSVSRSLQSVESFFSVGGFTWSEWFLPSKGRTRLCCLSLDPCHRSSNSTFASPESMQGSSSSGLIAVT